MSFVEFRSHPSGRTAIYETRTWEPVQMSDNPRTLERWESFFEAEYKKYDIVNRITIPSPKPDFDTDYDQWTDTLGRSPWG